jgi:hypothetical protein
VSSSVNIPVVSKFDPTGIKQAQSALSGFGKSLIGIGTLVAGAFAIRGIVNFGLESVIAAERAQQFNDILVQVAKTTNTFGGNLTAGTDRLIKFADAHELVIGVEAELIKEAQAVLLSFKAVGASANDVGGTFDRATKAAFDMAAVLKTDARGSAVQLGKALENPIKGVTALAKAGTTFTDQQKAQIRTLVESNRLLEAQDLILTEVESQYGGAAEAAALGSEKIKLAFGQVQDALGAALAPAFEKFTTYFINDVVPPLTKFFEDDFPRIIEELKPLAEGVMEFFGGIGDGLKEFLDIDADTSLLEGLLDKFNQIGENPAFQTFLTNVKDIFDEMAPLLAEIVFNVGELAAALTPLLEDALGRIIPLISDTAGIFRSINFFLGEIISSFGIFKNETPDFIKAIEDQLNPVARLSKLLQDLNRYLARAVELYRTFRGLGGKLPSELATGGRRFDLGERANGGRVTGGMPYMVGEMGPELFMPGRGGNVVPNDRLGSMGGGTSIVINVTAGMGTNGAQVGEQIVNAIKRYERVSGPVFASA